MANIWLVKEGQNPTVGGPVGEKSLEWCTNNLPYSQAKWLAPLDSPPKFGKSTRLDAISPPQHVVMEVGDQDVADPASQGWKTGFYLLLGLSVDEARQKLQK